MRSQALALLAGLVLAGAGHVVHAHDLITAASAERYLGTIERELGVVRSKDAPARRAQAQVAIGRTLDEIRDLLNRDIASHGKPQGLATLYLIEALQQHGVPLQVDRRLGRYPARLAEYREALALDANGPAAREARMRLLQGYFYDSFEGDPLAPREQDWRLLQAQIALGETLLAAGAVETDREEAEFILTIHYLQASRSAPDAGTRARFRDKAQAGLRSFRTRYPDSMRLPALDALAERAATPG